LRVLLLPYLALQIPGVELVPLGIVLGEFSVTMSKEWRLPFSQRLEIIFYRR
jgi:hypothetical protein